jgi:hypothetical protein
MASRFPVAVSFIYSPDDVEAASDIIELVVNSISRVESNLFSRNVDIPCFNIFSEDGILSISSDGIERNILVVFSSSNVTGSISLNNLYSKISFDENMVIPVSLESGGFGLSGGFKRKNFIRAYEYNNLESSLWILSEIYKYLACDGRKKINVFLSHAKADSYAVAHAKSFKNFIDNSSLGCFFDACDISPCTNFEVEIESSLQRSSLLVFNSDAYSSSYWCQKEVISAKNLERPVVVVDCLDIYQDRLLPAAANVPCHHITTEELTEDEIIKILITLVSETIRVDYFKKVAKYFIELDLLPSNVEVTVRPPEIRRILDYKARGVNEVCYPDPPLFEDEIKWVGDLGLKVYTPITGPNTDELVEKVFTISISDPGNLPEFYGPDALSSLSKKIVKYIFGSNAKIQYGGDFRKEGFTQFMIEELAIINSRLNHKGKPLTVYKLGLSANEEFRSFYSKYNALIKVEEIEELLIDVDEQVNRKYQLSLMRRKMVDHTDYMIVSGGKLSGFSGLLPGVLEEVLIGIFLDVPVYIYSSYGGVSEIIFDYFLGDSDSISIIDNIFDIALDSINEIGLINPYTEYNSMINKFRSITISEIASLCFLSIEEYSLMSRSRISDVNIAYLLKGSKNSSLK